MDLADGQTEQRTVEPSYAVDLGAAAKAAQRRLLLYDEVSGAGSKMAIVHQM